nr:HSPC190 [Homo sapiens]
MVTGGPWPTRLSRTCLHYLGSLEKTRSMKPTNKAEGLWRHCYVGDPRGPAQRRCQPQEKSSSPGLYPPLKEAGACSDGLHSRLQAARRAGSPCSVLPSCLPPPASGHSGLGGSQRLPLWTQIKPSDLTSFLCKRCLWGWECRHWCFC